MSGRTIAKNGRRSEDAPRARPLADSVLRRIWQERRISRAEIARQADLSRSTVSEIVGGLLRTRLVAEVGTGPSRGGRRPIVLEFQDDACTILGIEMGASHVATTLTDLRGRVLAWREVSHPVRSDPEGTRERMIQLAEECLAAAGRSADSLVGIGVAVPSPVDPMHPDRLPKAVMPDWNGSNGLSVLSSRFGAPLFIDNDANLGALAEHWWGDGEAVENFAYIKVATGIGSGHIIDGEIYRGAKGVAGEIGHLAIDTHGERCMCGLRGCLVTFVGAQALVSRAKAQLPKFPGSQLASVDVTIESIEDAALAGDHLAMGLAQEAAEHLGIAVVSMLNLMNPSMVIIGGGLARLGELILAPLRRTVHDRTLVSSLPASAIRTSRLGPPAVALGASTLVLKNALDDSSLFPAVKTPAKVG